jgi:signal transduction histidine kinase
VTHPLPLERALDVVSDVFVVFDKDFRLTYHNAANRSAMRDAGMDPDAAVGRYVLDAMPQLDGTTGFRESQRALVERVQTEWEESYGPDVRLRGRAYPTSDGGILVVATNITAEWHARERAERSIRWADHFHLLTAKLAAAASPDDVARVVLDEARAALEIDRGSVNMLDSNTETIRLIASTGYDERELDPWRSYPKQRGSISRDVLDTLIPAFFQSRADAAASWGDDLVETLRRLGIGSIAYVPVAITRVTRLLFNFAWSEPRQITIEERAFIQTFAAQSAQAFERAMAFDAAQEARAAAERANRAKGDFLAAMSHELRTPLNAIGGYTELLARELRGPLNEKQHSDLSRIARNQHHLLTIIDEILNFARLESGKLELDVRPVPAHEVVGGLEPLLAPQLAQKGLQLTLEPGEMSFTMHADRDKVGQILLNLTGNATKFTEPGGEIRVSIGGSDSEVLIHVCDTGVGIPPDKLDAIFEPYEQVHRALKQSIPGTGLGLAISRDLARQMGGDIRVTSEVGRGSTFTLSIPRAPSL